MVIYLNKYILRSLTPFLIDNSAKPNKGVVIVRNDGIGDFLLFSGLLKRYSEHYTDISVIVNSCIQEMASLYLPQNNVITVDSRFNTDLSYRRSWLNNLRKRGFKTLISSIHRSSLGDDIAHFSGIPERIGYSGESLRGKEKSAREYTTVIKGLPSKIPYTHVIDHELNMFSTITKQRVTREEVEPYIPIDTSTKDYFVLLPDCGNNKRTYDFETLLGLTLKATALKCIIISNKARDTIDNKRVIDLLGKTTISDAIKIISKARFVIGGETGLTHAAWIMNKPTVMIYGGGHYGRFLPFKSASVLTSNKNDCFCCDWRCKYTDNKYPCISSITEEQILEAICEI